jgi:hypothetical protein
MEKPRFLVLMVLGLACLLLLACQTGGTPKKSDGTPKKTQTATATQAPPTADSASPKKTASKSADKKRSVSAAQRKDLKVKPVDRSRRPSLAVFGKHITTLRAILYATLGLILIIVFGAITAERMGRRRKLA